MSKKYKCVSRQADASRYVSELLRALRRRVPEMFWDVKVDGDGSSVIMSGTSVAMGVLFGPIEHPVSDLWRVPPVTVSERVRVNLDDYLSRVWLKE